MRAAKPISFFVLASAIGSSSIERVSIARSNACCMPGDGRLPVSRELGGGVAWTASIVSEIGAGRTVSTVSAERSALLVTRRRLHEVLEHTKAARLDRRGDGRRARHQDERHVGIVGADDIEDVDARGARKIEIAEDRVKRSAFSTAAAPLPTWTT